MQAGSPNHRELRRLRAVVVSVPGKGPARPGQVSDEKTNMCEPLLTHRKIQRRHRNRGRCTTPGQGHGWSMPGVRKRPACGPDGVRCKGGVSSSQALAWNRRTCRPDTGGQPEWPNLACWPRRGRTPSGRNREGQSTAGHRGGTARSSGEGPVMGLERRGRAGQIDLMSTRKGRN